MAFDFKAMIAAKKGDKKIVKGVKPADKKKNKKPKGKK